MKSAILGLDEDKELSGGDAAGSGRPRRARKYIQSVRQDVALRSLAALPFFQTVRIVNVRHAGITEDRVASLLSAFKLAANVAA